jgi:hypothetical protein
VHDVTGTMQQHMSCDILKNLQEPWCHLLRHDIIKWCPSAVNMPSSSWQLLWQKKNVTGYWAWDGLVQLSVTKVWNVEDSDTHKCRVWLKSLMGSITQIYSSTKGEQTRILARL